ncbi:MAG: hypothetical protein K5765_00785, partial [Clostridia bacterium]|nr:hypothetical protein [Clostridia bacterium]
IDSNPNNIDLNTSNNYVIIHLTVGVKNPYYSQYSGYKDFENNIYEPYSNGILYATNESIGNVYKIIPVPYYYKAGDVAISGPTADNPGNNVTNRNFIQDDKVIINEKVKVVIENDALGELIINPLQLSIVIDGNVQSSLPSILNDHIVYENGDNDQTVYFDKFYDGSQIVYDASGNLVSGNISFFIDDYTYVPSSNNVLSSYNNIFDYDKDVNSLAISYEFRYENFLANAIYKSSNVYTDLEKYNISVLINNISIGVSQTETMYKIRNSYITSNIKVLMPANNQVGNDLIPTYLYGNIYNKQINIYALDNPEKDVNEISDYTRIYGYDFIPVVRVATYDNHIFNVADNPTFLQYYQNKYDTTLNVSERFYADFYYQTYFSNCPSFVFYGELQEALRTYNETYKVDNVFIYLGLEGEDTTNLGKDYTKDFIKYKSFNYEQNENSVYLNDFFDYTEAFENDDNLTKTIQPFLNDYDYEADPAYNILTMFNKLNYQEETTVNLDTNYFINWIVDLTNNIIISPTTNPGTYTLYIDDEYAIANYVLKKSDLKSSFEILIKKQVLKAGNQEFPDVNDTIKERTVLYEVYSGTSNYDKILKHEYADYEDCYITINHPQYDELFDMFNNGGYFDVKNSNPAVITLKEFREYYQIYNPSDPKEYISHTSSFTQDMLDFKLAGTYVIDILLPDTSHYTMDGPFVYTFTITQAELYIYPTVGIRTYMTTYDESKEISFNNTPVLIGNEGIEGHAQKINTNTGEFSNDGNEIVYVKENEYDDCSIVYMLYTGFVNSEDFSTYSSTYEYYLAPRLTLEHSYEKDANNHNIDYAGFYTSTDNQAFIGNYCRVMNYHVNFMTSVFYIKRQNLTLDIEQYQFTTYSGDNVSLDYVITNDNGDSLPDGLTSLNREAYAYYIVNDSPIVDDDIYYKNYKTQPISYGKAEYNKDSLSYFSGVISESHYYYRYYFIKPNGEKIYLINEGNNDFSYLDENEQKIYISDKIYFKVNNIKTDYIAESYFYETPTEHLCIYLELSPSNNVNNDKTIQDIVYINGVKAGIIWNTYAEIDPNAGQQILNNFMNSNSKYVFFDINKLEIVLCDNDKEIYDPDNINFSIYPVLHSSYSPDSEYMISAGNFYVFGNDLSRFISSSWVSSSIIENYYISPMIISEFELSSNYLERFYLSLSDQGDFDKQINLNPINSGLYVLLVEVTNENSNNIYFSTQTAQNSLFGETKTNVNDDKTYIICYLVLERTSNININVAMIDESGEGNQSNVIVENKEVELSKTYDAIRPEFSVTSLVINNFDIINNTDNTSLFDNLLVNYRAVLYPNFNSKNNNETINEYIIRTYEELLSTNRLYSSNDSELENISNDLKSLMTNSGDYYIVYCINYDDGDTYNYNVATYYYIVNVIINKR